MYAVNLYEIINEDKLASPTGGNLSTISILLFRVKERKEIKYMVENYSEAEKANSKCQI